MGGALSSYHISAGSIYQYSTTLCALRPIWSRFILKIFLRIILGSWSTPRFTKRPLTSTSGRATLTQTSTCLTLLSSFQSGRYIVRIALYFKDNFTQAQTLVRCRAWMLRKLIHLRELRGEKKLFPSCGSSCVALTYTNTNTNDFIPRYLNSLLGPRRRGRGQRGLILLDHHW